jgi:hypothetical protein
MQIHPQVTEQNGIISVTMQALFTGADTDATDRALILALGDPQVNLGGSYTDPNNTSFTFTFPAAELFVGITTQMSGVTARFMTVLPAAQVPLPGEPQYPGWSQRVPLPPERGPLDCITQNPTEAATVWAAAIQTKVQTAMTTLREQSATTSLPNATI